MFIHQLFVGALLAAAPPAAEPPESWIDPDTGHRVVRLTKEPGSASLYLNQNGYTAGGKGLVYTTPDGISVLDLAKRQARQVVKGRARPIEAGRKHPRVYYLRDGAVLWTHIDTGERTWHHLQRNEWSIHFNVTRDGKLLCGDGGDPGQVARAPDGRWIYLFRPELIPNRGTADPGFVQPGVLRAERLVNMSRHEYRLEPNVSFTPDQKWVVFRSNMFGPTYVFAVEVAKAAAP